MSVALLTTVVLISLVVLVVFYYYFLKSLSPKRRYVALILMFLVVAISDYFVMRLFAQNISTDCTTVQCNREGLETTLTQLSDQNTANKDSLMSKLACCFSEQQTIILKEAATRGAEDGKVTIVSSPQKISLTNFLQRTKLLYLNATFKVEKMETDAHGKIVFLEIIEEYHSKPQ